MQKQWLIHLAHKEIDLQVYLLHFQDIDYEKMVELHDRLLSQNPPHNSPLEHTAQVPTQYEYDMALTGEEKGWFYNLKGFKSYRHIIETQNE